MIIRRKRTNVPWGKGVAVVVNSVTLPGVKIVIYEDDADVASFQATVLEANGFEVIPLISQEDRSASFVAPFWESVDVVVVDLRSSGKSGTDLIDFLATAAPHVRTVVSTGGYVEPALRARVDEVLLKPYPVAALLAAIRGGDEARSDPHSR